MGRAKRALSSSHSVWQQSIVDPLVFCPFSYRTHNWAKSRIMSIESKLKSSPGMYARQRHLSFFFLQVHHFRKWRWHGNFQAKKWSFGLLQKKKKKKWSFGPGSRLQMNIHISARCSDNFTNHLFLPQTYIFALASQKW